MHAADYERRQSVGRVLRHAEPDVPAHRVAHEVRFRQNEFIQYRRYVLDAALHHVVNRVMWLVARTVPTSIDHDQLIRVAEPINVAVGSPFVAGSEESVVQDERRSRAVNLEVH